MDSNWQIYYVNIDATKKERGFLIWKSIIKNANKDKNLSKLDVEWKYILGVILWYCFESPLYSPSNLQKSLHMEVKKRIYVSIHG